MLSLLVLSVPVEYFDNIRVHEKYPELSTAIQIVLVLSHGQASVERGLIIWFSS